ncbi:hypothetical protein Tco_0780252, partial [Tanacetum coccineum]
KTNKKNDVKARSLLLMALPNEHQLTFSQYTNAKTMFATIEIRFRVITQEDLNSKFLRSLPPEWNTHVVVWMNKADIKTMSIDDLYNNFKIVEQDIKKSVGTKTGDQNMAFMSAPSTSSTNNVNTANSDVSTISTNINTASPKDSTATLSDATVYAFLANQPNGSQLVHEDLEQIHDDDLEEMDLKWQLALLSVLKAEYEKVKQEKDGIDFKIEKFDNATKSLDKMLESQITDKNGVGFDWSGLAEEQIKKNNGSNSLRRPSALPIKKISLSHLEIKGDSIWVKKLQCFLKENSGCKDYDLEHSTTGMIKVLLIVDAQGTE